jgi:hypothetical protein
MLSVVLYGRNDSHGYNLHKRASISLNCIAELLTEKDDEILFVDYNTPDDYPTFIEAIQDLLTPKAQEKIKIIRVRPEFHKKHYEGKTHLVALEPIARNIAIRRSNPNNRWILSTNTDMVFTPLDESCRSLGKLFQDLSDGFYELPRFEMPESLWEGIDRKDPKAIISSFKKWGRDFRINEIIYGHPTILYDAPGDFQLILRKDLFEIAGFDEGMILGWHVDSNICKRLHLKYKETKSAIHLLYGYHCDHTRQATKMHGADSPENCMKKFIDEVKKPHLPSQQETWGAPHDNLEMFHLKDSLLSSAFVNLLNETIKPYGSHENIPSIHYSNTYNHYYSYDTFHVYPYLIDQLISFSKDIIISYHGFNPILLSSLSQGLKKLGFQNPVHLSSSLKDKDLFHHMENCSFLDQEQLIEKANIFIIDFGFQEGQEPLLGMGKAEFLHMQMEGYLENIIRKEQKKPISQRSHVLGINAINNTYEEFFTRWIYFTRTPYSSRIRRGIVRNDSLLEEKLKSLKLLRRLKRGIKKTCSSIYYNCREKIIESRDDLIEVFMIYAFKFLGRGRRQIVSKKIGSYARRYTDIL